ncbi:hypothetical protein KY284_003983 [Solanum tuberosum]|nr:hypothetical protein KY284_003983 [Solanum tuberosum]
MADQGLEGSQPVDLTKHPSGIVPTLQNIVSTVNLDCKLDLKAIALQARNAEYNPKRFAAVIMRIREPKTTALIFASGKMVCTGAKSEQQSKLAARKYARIIQKLGFPAKFKDFKIQNIVGSCDVKFPIRLEGLAYAHGAFSSYEPELFPGLIYRMKQPKIVLLIFVSGKIVITGAKVRDETYTAFENIYPVLTEFRKNQQWYDDGLIDLMDCGASAMTNCKGWFKIWRLIFYKSGIGFCGSRTKSVKRGYRNLLQRMYKLSFVLHRFVSSTFRSLHLISFANFNPSMMLLHSYVMRLEGLSASSRSTMNCQCGIATRIFTGFTPTNVVRRFYKCSKPNGYKCDYWKWVDDPLHPRVANFIHDLKKENDNLHREKKALETRMVILKVFGIDIGENCECLDEINVSKSEQVVVDNEEVVVDKSLVDNNDGIQKS